MLLNNHKMGDVAEAMEVDTASTSSSGAFQTASSNTTYYTAFSKTPSDTASSKSGTPSPSTLYSRSLNTPGTTTKGLYVDQQLRYIIQQRVSKIVTRIDTTVTYIIKGESSDEKKTLQLKNMWSQVDWLAPGTLVNIVGVKENQTGVFIVDRLQGYLIVEPDRLVSVTSVVSQLYCERKAALSRFYTGGDSAVTFRGVVAHELICIAMVKGLKDDTDLVKIVKRICQRPGMLERAYGVGMTDEELSKIEEDVVQWVGRFMRQRYFGSSQMDPKYQNFKFMKVIGVEDNIWNPMYGMKGKIDATVLIEKDSQPKIVPLEFKTGSTKSQQRQSIRAEHIAQVTLYTLMMSMKFGSIEDAVLYYISDDSLSVHPQRVLELQHLILQRNFYIRNTTLANGELPNLPRPEGIDFDFKCKNCDVRNICTLQITRKDAPIEALVSTEKKLVESCMLSKEELKFFDDWLVVINSETEEVEKKFNDKLLWTKSPEEREAGGTCVTNLKIVGKESLQWRDSNLKPGYMVTFSKRNKKASSDHGLHVDDFVALSSNVEVCINYGIVVLIRGDEITLSLDQMLHPEYFHGNFIFTIDKINTTSPIASQYGYLAKLMESTEEASRLREYIIMKKQPKFQRLVLPEEPVQEIMKDLNMEQKRVIMKSLSTDSFLFVKGSPGSGKTATIVSLLRTLVYMKKSVLVVSYTGTALENILIRYQVYNQNFIKISTSGRTDAKLTKFTTKEISKSVKRIDQLQEEYNKPVVATTLLSLKHPIFQVRRFDYCIIDEASQALPTAVFGALSLCDKYIVFGDPHQLPPVMASPVLKTHKISDNFFSLMATPVSTIKMNIQYRMNLTITNLANRLMYDNQMVCGDVNLEKAYLQLPSTRLRDFLLSNVTVPDARRVFCHVVSKKRERAVVFLDTSNVSAFESKNEESIRNEAEKNLAVSCSMVMVESGLHPEKVGIIAPYRGQVRLIRSALDRLSDTRYPNIEVNTVDQYQGREMDVIICSFTKSMPKESPCFKSGGGTNDNERESILEDMRRLNVAITRAKVKLVLIGNRETLSRFNPFRKLFDILEEGQCHKLTASEFEGMCQLSITQLHENNENVPNLVKQDKSKLPNK